MLREFRTLIPFVKRYRWWYVGGILSLIVTDSAQLLVPQFVKRAIDIIASGPFPLQQILPYAFLIVGVAVVTSLGRFCWRNLILGVSIRIETELRSKLYLHLQTLSSTFYGGQKIGDLMARFTNDMKSIRMSTGWALTALVDGLFMTTAIVIILLSQDSGLAILTICPLPLITLFIVFFGRAIGPKFLKVQEGFSSLSEVAQESLSGVRVLKTFVQEAASVRRFARTNEEYCRRHMSLIRIWGVMFPMVAFLSGITILILLLFGGRAVMEGRISPGDFAAFLAYLNMLVWPMVGAGFTVNMIQRGSASLGRINRILEAKADIKNLAKARKSFAGGTIEIRDLTYRYPGASKPVLDGISLEIPEGKIVGILGRTGSGKSTLVKLLPRLLDPPAGTVFIGGRDVRSYDLQALRSKIGVVLQDPFLFSTSIHANIGFAQRDMDKELIHRMGDISTIARDLKLFPDGFDTVVGERGITLSGGQKQRVTLSRALAIDPLILILDDAFSSVDTETEDAILRGLVEYLHGRTMLHGRTVLIISHRISTLKMSDLIVVLEQGKIVQQGTHDKLIRQEGFYQEIYNIQQLADSRQGGV